MDARNKRLQQLISNGKAPLLLALPFALVGVVTLLFSVIPALYDWGRMHSWVAVEASLISAKVDSHSSGLKQSTAYKATSIYSYDYNQKSYQGARIGIHDQGYDNIGSWHTTTIDEMERMDPLHVWVNPENPGEAIFDRTMRWDLFSFSMIFVLIFGGLGFLGISSALHKDKATHELPSRNQIKPDRRRSHTQSDSQIWGLWYVTLTAGLFFFWIIFQIIIEWERGNTFAVIGLLLPLVYTTLFVKLVRMTVAWRQLGVMPLYLNPLPAVIGRNINGLITLNRCLPKKALAGAGLSCIAKTTRHFGKRARTERSVVWSEQRLLQCDNKLGSNDLTFSFRLPESLPGAIGHNLEWKLTVRVKCDSPGIDHTRVYTIPVALT